MVAFIHSLLGFKELVFEKADYLEDAMVIHAHVRKHLQKCSCCGSSKVHIQESYKKTFRSNNIGISKFFINCTIYKFLCLQCNESAWMEVPFAFKDLPVTKAFAEYVYSFQKKHESDEIAQFCDLECELVEKIKQAYLGNFLS